jgi:hypothetical protein
MMKTGSELVSEMVGPAGSTRDGAFSCTSPCAEEEACPFPEGAVELLGDWAQAAAGGIDASRQRTATDEIAENLVALNVMENPV